MLIRGNGQFDIVRYICMFNESKCALLLFIFVAFYICCIVISTKVIFFRHSQPEGAKVTSFQAGYVFIYTFNKPHPNLPGRIVRNSYTMGCPPVRGDNPRALASGLSFVQMDKHGITTLLYTTYISVELAHRKIYHAKVGKGGIKSVSV